MVSEGTTAEVSELVLALLRGAAPERADELAALWRQFALNFDTIQDKPGFDIKGGAFGSVIFTPRTLHQIWLLGFAAWRAFEAYGGILQILPALGLPYDAAMIADLPGQLEAELRFQAAIHDARALNQVHQSEDFEWPAAVPLPSQQSFTSAAEEVTRDVTSIAGAFIFLHEVKHIVLTQSGTDPHEEELACDQFAREFLLENITAYASTSGKPSDRILALRAMAVSVGLFVVLEITPVSSWRESESHPPLRKRWTAFLEPVPLPIDHWFWSFTTSLILAKLRHEHRGPEQLDAADARGLCFEFINLL
ncbi:MAG: phage exclusion protein Lit family protein [Bryobacteraceae bacterium]|jgi:hypothetical protein